MATTASILVHGAESGPQGWLAAKLEALGARPRWLEAPDDVVAQLDGGAVDVLVLPVDGTRSVQALADAALGSRVAVLGTAADPSDPTVLAAAL